MGCKRVSGSPCWKAPTKKYNDGEVVVAENTVNSDIFAIVAGEVRVVVGSGADAVEVARLTEVHFWRNVVSYARHRQCEHRGRRRS